MELNLLLSCAIGVSFLVFVVVYLKQRQKLIRFKSEKEAIVVQDYENKLLAMQTENAKIKELNYQLQSGIEDSESGNISGCVIQNQSGENLVTVHQLFKFPEDAIDISDNKDLTKWATHLTSDIVKAGMSIPNKSIELAFKPNIQQGLDSGSYIMQTTKTNEVLADVIDPKTGKIVGKGRIVEGGKMKRFLTGGYHLVSIAVAQSHLSEITEKLDRLNAKLNEIQKHMEIVEKAKIKGAINYFQEVLDKTSENKLELEKGSPVITNLESCIVDSHEWVEVALGKFEELNGAIKTLEDKDTFGTGSSYTEVKRLLERAKTISHFYDLILKFDNISAALLGYIDPYEKSLTRPVIQHDKWRKLMSEFKRLSLSKTKKLFKSATFNSSDTLALRRENIEYSVTNTHELMLENLDNYQVQQKLINEQLKMLKAEEIRVGLSFNEDETIQKAALLS